MPFASVRFPTGRTPSGRTPSGRTPSVRALVIAPAIGLIRAYQLVVSPMRPATCRFYPSCSAYALTAIERFGLVRGSWLATRRLLRCHPWNPGGVDHVPAPLHDRGTNVNIR